MENIRSADNTGDQLYEFIYYSKVYKVTK